MEWSNIQLVDFIETMFDEIKLYCKGAIHSAYTQNDLGSDVWIKADPDYLKTGVYQSGLKIQ